jgi:hypothetical protein
VDILAHERGHQILARHPRIARRVAGKVEAAAEEILASLLGAMLCESETDRASLLAKAMAELLDHGQTMEAATGRMQDLWDLFKELL